LHFQLAYCERGRHSDAPRLQGLELVGLFRISASSSVVEYYKSQYDQGVDVGFANCNDPHIAANLLKMYFRELPEPLFTFELYDAFIAIGMLSLSCSLT